MIRKLSIIYVFSNITKSSSVISSSSFRDILESLLIIYNTESGHIKWNMKPYVTKQNELSIHAPVTLQLCYLHKSQIFCVYFVRKFVKELIELKLNWIETNLHFNINHPSNALKWSRDNAITLDRKAVTEWSCYCLSVQRYHCKKDMHVM